MEPGQGQGRLELELELEQGMQELELELDRQELELGRQEPRGEGRLLEQGGRRGEAGEQRGGPQDGGAGEQREPPQGGGDHDGPRERRCRQRVRRHSDQPEHKQQKPAGESLAFSLIKLISMITTFIFVLSLSDN